MARLETEFKKWFRKNWKGWLEAYEPRRGGGVGVPDIQIAVDGRIVPIELKVGEFDVEENYLWVSDIRPVQLAWHKQAELAGIRTFFLVGAGYYVCLLTPNRIGNGKVQVVPNWSFHKLDDFNVEFLERMRGILAK